MREIRALIWKEWSETRLFLWIAWGLFIGLPIIGGFEGQVTNPGHRFEFSASPWIILFGGVLAIVVGVAGTCRDLQTKLEDFWQSRPMGSVRLFTIKYLVGLCVVLLACVVPLVVELLTIRDPSEAEAAFFLSLLWMAAFSTAFAAGCFFHRPSHAAAVAVLGVLLIYFVPIVFPPLGQFNIGNVFDGYELRYWGQHSIPTGLILDFAAGMTVIAVVMGCAGILAVLFRWNIESGRPLIFGAAACAFLILVESAAFQLGTNLPVLGVAVLPGVHSAAYLFHDDLVVHGSTGVLTTRVWSDPQIDGGEGFRLPFSVVGNQLNVGAERRVHFGAYEWLSGSAPRSRRNRKILYNVTEDETEPNAVRVDRLEIFSEENGGPERQGVPIELWRGPSKTLQFPYARVWNDRLFIIGERTIVFDISDPLYPRRLSDDPIKWVTRGSVIESKEPTIDLPPAPGMSPAERLNFAISIYDHGDVFDGTIWCRVYAPDRNRNRESMLQELRLKSLTENTAQFESVGEYNATLIESIVGEGSFSSLKMNNGLLYAPQYNCVNVFSLTGPRPMRLIAHFAAPGQHLCVPLDDGRAVVSGDGKLYLLGPPPNH